MIYFRDFPLDYLPHFSCIKSSLPQKFITNIDIEHDRGIAFAHVNYYEYLLKLECKNNQLHDSRKQFPQNLFSAPVFQSVAIVGTKYSVYECAGYDLALIEMVF